MSDEVCSRCGGVLRERLFHVLDSDRYILDAHGQRVADYEPVAVTDRGNIVHRHRPSGKIFTVMAWKDER